MSTGDTYLDLYNQGHTIQQIAHLRGVSHNRVYEQLRRDPEYKPRRGGWRRRQRDKEFWEPSTEHEAQDVIRRYHAGATVRGLAESIHVRCVGPVNETDMRRFLRRRGVQLRSNAETSELLGSYAANIGAGEHELAGELARAGFAPVQQKIVAGRNVDIAVDPVAIEVQTCTGRAAVNQRQYRIDALLAVGWSVLYVMRNNTRDLTDYGKAQVVEHVHAARLYDSPPELTVMWADGEPA